MANRNQIQVHWVPGHKDIVANELTDKQNKAAAMEMMAANNNIQFVMDKKEAVSEIKKQIREHWNRKYQLSEKVKQIQDTNLEDGNRNCFREEDRQNFSVLNQLLSGHSGLNSHRARIDNKTPKLCGKCQQPEDTNHYSFQCNSYKEKKKRERDTHTHTHTHTHTNTHTHTHTHTHIRDDSGRYFKRRRNRKWHSGHWALSSNPWINREN